MRSVKTSLDNHLRTSSYISADTAKKAVKMAGERLGNGGIVGILDYNGNTRDPRWEHFLNGLPYDKVNTGNGVYLPEKDLLFVHGQEVPTSHGELLLIGTLPSEYVPNNLSMLETLKTLDLFDVKPLVIAAAPYHKGGSGEFLRDQYAKAKEEILSRIDGIEVFSGEAANSLLLNYWGANKRARTLYEALTNGKIGPGRGLFPFRGDDGHSVDEIGKTWQRIVMQDAYTAFRDNPTRLNRNLRQGHIAAKKNGEDFKETPAAAGATNHMADLMLIMAMQKLGVNPNTKLAPFLERFGLQI